MKTKAKLVSEENLGIPIEGITKQHLIRPQFCGVSVQRAFIVGFTQQGLDGEENGPNLEIFQS